MSRYLRLYTHFLRFSFSKAMQFRLDFSFRIIMDIFYYLVNILFFNVIFLHTNIIGGWTQEQMMVFVASYLLVDAINMTVFSNNMWWIPYLINKGELDYYLIRPVSPLFFLSFREFSANSFLNLIIAVGFFIYSLLKLPMNFGLSELFFFILTLLNGSLIYYTTQLLMILPVFWTHSSRGFVDLFYSIGLAMERPDRIYRGWVRMVFTIILPFALIASFPAKLFLEKFDWGTLLHLIAVTVGLFSFMLFIWNRGLKNYSSASS